MIDGTAPHERDAKIPGAKEELINLGDGWDNRILTAEANEILELMSEKENAYKTAYHYLHSAGVHEEFIKQLLVRSFDENKAKSRAEAFLGRISEENDRRSSLRLISSFGKGGEYRLDTLDRLDTEKISLGGGRLCAMIFINQVNRFLDLKSPSKALFPSALDPTLTEAIYIVNQDLVLKCDANGDIDSDSLFNLSATDTDRIKRAQSYHDELLDEARRWFNIASDFHFRLEKIYGEAMDFTVNDMIFSQKSAEIDEILETSG